eukprot:scaffold34938_cov53-Attheya_sp.AAC.3
MGKRTPMRLSLTHIMAPKQATCNSVKAVVVRWGTEDHRSLAETLLSLNKPQMRANISLPGSADVPRYIKRPMRTGRGTWVKRARGLANMTEHPISV